MGVIVLSALAVRLFFLFNHAGMWGVDGGAYLLSRNAVLGYEPTGADFPRPFLAPGWLLVPFTALLGDGGGLKAFSLAASFVIVPPFLLLARKFLTPWQTVAALFFVSFDWMLAEMFTAGPLPMFGFAWMLLAMWAIATLNERRDWRASVALAVAIPGIAYMNQTSAGIPALVLPLFTAVTLAQHRDAAGFRRVALAGAIGLALAATAWHWYVSVAPGSGYTRYPGPLISFYSPSSAAWFQLPLGLIVGGYAVWRGRGFVRSLGAVTLLLSVMTPLVASDESTMNVFYRGRYLLMAMVALLATWAVGRTALQSVKWRPYALGYLGVLAVAVFGGYLVQLHFESKVGRMVTTDTEAAIGWVMAQEPRGSIVTNSYSLSLYVAALTRHRSPWTQIYDPPALYATQHGQVVCLLGWVDGCDPASARDALDADYVVAETMWPTKEQDVGQRIQGVGEAYRVVHSLNFFRSAGNDIGRMWQAPEHVWDVTARTPWLELVWERGTTKVWRVNT